MITQNEPLAAIQARREELHHTITERKEQIAMRAEELVTKLKKEVSPITLIKKHPGKAACAAFLSGLLLTKAFGGHRTPSAGMEYREQYTPPPFLPTPGKTALSAIGFELLRSVKDIGFSYLQRYLEKKIR